MEGTSTSGKFGIPRANFMLPHMFFENYQQYYVDPGDYQLAEVLQNQEIVYQSLKTGGNGRNTANGMQPHFDSGTSSSSHYGEHKEVADKGAELINDEALARALQELEDQLAVTSLNANALAEYSEGSSMCQAMNKQSDSASAFCLTTQALEQDDIDPDNMTYEELQSLGEAIGNQSKGLSEDLISCLPSYTYKTGIFSKKENPGECVICYMAYKNKDRLTNLPCKHQYHSGCISRWLKLNKVCPVCNAEVFG